MRKDTKGAGFTAFVTSLAALPIILFCALTHLSLYPALLCYVVGGLGTLVFIRNVVTRPDRVQAHEVPWIIFMSALWPLFLSTMLAALLIRKIDDYADF